MIRWINDARQMVEHWREHDREIQRQHASIRQNTQAIQSGARVLETISGMIELTGPSKNDDDQ